ncbi:hypothetical protein L1887_40473 [Cichorium endivia]|nr:hypothetical protein L1887_40473 [Cichorium endivia]
MCLASEQVRVGARAVSWSFALLSELISFGKVVELPLGLGRRELRKLEVLRELLAKRRTPIVVPLFLALKDVIVVDFSLVGSGQRGVGRAVRVVAIGAREVNEAIGTKDRGVLGHFLQLQHGRQMMTGEKPLRRDPGAEQAVRTAALAGSVSEKDVSAALSAFPQNAHISTTSSARVASEASSAQGHLGPSRAFTATATLLLLAAGWSERLRAAYLHIRHRFECEESACGWMYRVKVKACKVDAGYIGDDARHTIACADMRALKVGGLLLLLSPTQGTCFLGDRIAVLLKQLHEGTQARLFPVLLDGCAGRLVVLVVALGGLVVVLVRGLVRVELAQQLRHRRTVGVRVELEHLGWLERHAHLARGRMHDKRRLEQMIEVLGHLCIDTRIGVLEDDVFQAGSPEPLALVLARPLRALHHVLPLFQAGPVRCTFPLGAQLFDRLGLAGWKQLQEHRPLLWCAEAVLVLEHRVDEGELERATLAALAADGASQARMQAPSACTAHPACIDLFDLAGTALDDLEPSDDGFARVVGEVESFAVRDPYMDTTTTRIDPEQMLEAEILAQRLVEHLHRDGDKRPATLADALTRTACAHLVVVRHVDIEYQLALHGLERSLLHGFAVFGLGRVDRANLESRRVEATHLFLELVGGRERVVTQVGLVLERKGELAVREALGGRHVRQIVVEPGEELLPRKETAVEAEHGHGVGRVAHLDRAFINRTEGVVGKVVLVQIHVGRWWAHGGQRRRGRHDCGGGHRERVWK